MSDPDRVWGAMQFLRRIATKHDCPRCECRERIQAVLWNGFNIRQVRDFMERCAPDFSVGVGNHCLIIPELVSPVPPGHWLYAGDDKILRKAEPMLFLAAFERP